MWPAAETPVFSPIFHLLTNAGCCENSNTVQGSGEKSELEINRGRSVVYGVRSPH